MSALLEQEIIQRLHTLDEPKLLEVLDFVDFLAQRRRAVDDREALESPRDQGVTVTGVEPAVRSSRASCRRASSISFFQGVFGWAARKFS